MPFIRLRDSFGKESAVNSDHIIRVQEDDRGALVFVNNSDTPIIATQPAEKIWDALITKEGGQRGRKAAAARA